MPHKQEKDRSRGDLADPASGPEDHVADASDAGSWGSTLVNDGAQPDPPQPPPHDFSGSDERVRRAHALRAEAETAESVGGADDATGGESWNRVLGDNTNAGTLRLLAAIGLFILVSASLFWLIAG